MRKIQLVKESHNLEMMLYKLLRFTDLTMLQTILFTFLSSMTKELYMAMYITSIDHNAFADEYIYYVTLVFNNTFFMMAFVLTFSKWLNFQIMAQSQVNKDRDQYQKKTKVLHKITTNINIGLFVVCLLISALIIGFHHSSFGHYYDVIYAYFSVVLYTCGLISITIVTYNLMTVLKTHYPEFYYQERKMILVMVFVLIAAMMGKLAFGSYRIYLGSDIGNFLDQSEQRDDWISPTFWTVNFCVTEFAPVCAILLSFWYGLFRRNKVIRSRKYSSNNEIEQLDRSPSMFDNDDDEYFSYNPFGMGPVTKMSRNFRGTRDNTIISSTLLNKERDYSILPFRQSSVDSSHNPNAIVSIFN
eukprot:403360394